MESIPLTHHFCPLIINTPPITTFWLISPPIKCSYSGTSDKGSMHFFVSAFFLAWSNVFRFIHVTCDEWLVIIFYCYVGIPLFELHRNLRIHSSVDNCLSCFQLLAIVNKLVHIFWWTNVLVSLGDKMMRETDDL